VIALCAAFNEYRVTTCAVTAAMSALVCSVRHAGARTAKQQWMLPHTLVHHSASSHVVALMVACVLITAQGGARALAGRATDRASSEITSSSGLEDGAVRGTHMKRRA
jgi:uncharacterized membrane protein